MINANCISPSIAFDFKLTNEEKEQLKIIFFPQAPLKVKSLNWMTLRLFDTFPITRQEMLHMIRPLIASWSGFFDNEAN